MRRPLELEVEEETVEKDVTDEYADTSERFEFVLDRDTSEASSLDRLVPAGVRPVGGTSCTWRFRGWLDLEGGGLTTMKDYRVIVLLAFPRDIRGALVPRESAPSSSSEHPARLLPWQAEARICRLWMVLAAVYLSPGGSAGEMVEERMKELQT